jgi:hypothetical protein
VLLEILETLTKPRQDGFSEQILRTPLSNQCLASASFDGSWAIAPSIVVFIGRVLWAAAL